MEYRKIEINELDALWELQKQYKREIGEEDPDDEGKKRLAWAVEKGTIVFFGAWEESILIGCCSVSVGFTTYDYRSSGVFDDFYILPKYRHQGIARSLVKHAYQGSGVSTLLVGCADCDEKMYRSLGFKTSLGNLLSFE